MTVGEEDGAAKKTGFIEMTLGVFLISEQTDIDFGTNRHCLFSGRKGELSFQ